MMILRRSIFIAFSVVVIVGFISCGGSDGKEEPASSPSASVVNASEITVKMQGTAGKYKYLPAAFTLSAGDSKDFKLVGDDELHTFTVEDLGINWELGPGETKSFSFTFSRAGTYKITCIPHPEMKGTITVQ